MRKLQKKLLREFTEIILCSVIAAVMGYAAHCHIRDVIHRTFADIIHTEWVQAARTIEPSQEISLGDDETKL